MSDLSLAFENAGLTSKNIDELHPDDALSLYIEVVKLKDSLDLRVKELGKIASSIEPEIIAYFQEKGQQKVTRNGRTVYLAREIWPKVIDSDLSDSAISEEQREVAANAAKSRLVDALANDPMTSHLVKASYNHQTLRSFMLNDLEQEDGVPIIPEHLQGKLGISEVFKAKVLKSG